MATTKLYANKAADNPTGLSAQHIAADLRSYEAARSGFFTLQVSGLNEIIKASYSGTEAKATANDKLDKQATEYLLLNVVKADVPHFSLETMSYRRGNEEIKFAGVPTFNSGTIVVDDVVGLDTKSILMAWQGLAYNIHTRRGGLMQDYKKTATLTEYTQDYTIIRSWELTGCWVSEISEDAFDKESDGKRQLTATIQYDRATMKLPGEETVQSGTVTTEDNT